MTELFLKLANVGAEWVLWLLVLLSFINIAIIIERFLYFRQNRVDGAALGTTLSELLRQGNVREAWNLVAESAAAECTVVAAGLTALQRGAAACGEAMQSAKARARTKLDAYLAILGTIGSNAPFIGLLGTVLGIIKAARDLGGAADKAGSTTVMNGVFEALIATAVGLLVAIPAVIFFNLFQRKVKTTLAQVDSLAHLILASASAERKSTPPSPAVKA